MPVLTTVTTRGKQNTDLVSVGLQILFRYKHAHTLQMVHPCIVLSNTPVMSSESVLSCVYTRLLRCCEKCQEA